VSDVVPKAELFRRLGYGGGHELLERALADAALSRPEKTGIAAAKEGAVAACLAEWFVPVCSRGDCQEEATHRGDGCTPVAAATQAACAICVGSAHARAVDEMVAAMRRAGIARLCVVGGSPNARTRLEALVAGRVELRLVDGTAKRTADAAKADVAWGDLVAVWGGTMLDHKVSKLYTGDRVFSFARRGIGELARAVVIAVERRWPRLSR
jgi:hypothetical protein